MRIPGCLAVVMRVDIHEARRDELAARIDLFAGGPFDVADGDDLAVLDRDIARGRAVPPVPSTRVPLRMMRSCMGVSGGCYRGL